MKQNMLHLIGAFAIIGICFYLGYEALRINKLAETGAVMSLNTEKFERTVSKGVGGDILILGDSLAYGVGASSTETSFAGKIATEYDESSIVNKAEIGETITSLKTTIDSKLTSDFDKIFIIVGGNDIMRIHINIYNSADNLDYVINKASQHSEKVVLLTTGNFDNVSLSPWILKSVFNKRAEIIRQAALNLEDTYENYSYIDFYSISFAKDQYKSYEAKDGYHLNDAGIDKLFSTMLEEM